MEPETSLPHSQQRAVRPYLSQVNPILVPPSQSLYRSGINPIIIIIIIIIITSPLTVLFSPVLLLFNHR